MIPQPGHRNLVGYSTHPYYAENQDLWNLFMLVIVLVLWLVLSVGIVLVLV
jgi:nitrate reductase NapE component